MQEKYVQILQKINESITLHLKEIEKCWVQKNVLVIEKSIMDIFYEYTKDLTTPEVHALMKKSFRDTLKLDSRDAIFFLNKKVVIKKFIHKEKMEKEVNARFGSIPPEELEQLVVKYFPKDIWSTIEPKIEGLMEEELDFVSITNKFFMDNYLKFLQRIFIKIVVDVVTNKEEKEVIGALGTFLLRKHFDAILLIMAKELAALAGNHDGTAEEFLRYYNGDTIVDTNKKPFIKPQIIDASKKVWHPSAVISMSLQHFQQLKKIQFQEAKFNPYKEEYEAHEQERKNLEVQIKNLTIAKETFDQTSKEFIEEVKATKNELNELREEAKKFAADTPVELSDRINILSLMYKNSYRKEEKIFDERKAMEKNMSDLNTRIINHKAENKVMQVKMESVKETLKSFKDELEPINIKYELSMHALAKTLSKKLTPG